MRNKLLALGVIGAGMMGGGANAQSWSEKFNKGWPSNWTKKNVDGLTPATNVNYVTDAWVTRQKTDANGNAVPNDSVIISTSRCKLAKSADSMDGAIRCFIYLIFSQIIFSNFFTYTF